MHETSQTSAWHFKRETELKLVQQTQILCILLIFSRERWACMCICQSDGEAKGEEELNVSVTPCSTAFLSPLIKTQQTVTELPILGNFEFINCHIRKNLNLMSHRWVHRTDWKRTKEGVVHSVFSAFSLFSTRPYKLSGLFLFFITLYLVSFHSMCWQSSTVKLKQSKEEKTQTPETIMAWIMGGNINFYIEHLAHGTS